MRASWQYAKVLSGEISFQNRKDKEKDMNSIVTSSTGVVGGIILVLMLGAAAGTAFSRSMTSSKVLSDNIMEPHNGATSAKVDIDTAEGNLTIDQLNGDEQTLASGILQYPEGQSQPTRTLNMNNSQTTLTLKNGISGRPWFHLPWAACNAATEWQIHLNPTVSSDITAHSGGGNVRLDLAGMTVTHVSADTRGGNVNVVLPDNAANLNVNATSGAGNVTVEFGSNITGSSTVIAKSGAGNVLVNLPSGIAARIHVTSGLGKVIVDSQFNKIDNKTYQSPDYDSAANKIEITLN